jgi:hypothetical protein
MLFFTTTFFARTQKPFAGTRVSALTGGMAMIFMLFSCSTNPRLGPHQQMALVKHHPYEGSHRTMDYQIGFAYTFHEGRGREPDRIEFSGRLVPRRGLDTFILRLHFLDESGHVLGTQVLYAPGAGRGAGRATISRVIEVPTGTVNIGFSHVAREQRIRPRGR